MKKLALTTLISCQALAGEAVIKYGVGVGNSAKTSKSEVVMGSMAYQQPFYGLFAQQVEVGGWGDRRADMGRQNSVFMGYSLGLNLNMGYLNAQAFWGVAGITNPDSYLGGPFQFNHDFAINFMDKRKVKLGVAYKHVSSAGIEKPNIGRDFFMIRVGLPW